VRRGLACEAVDGWSTDDADETVPGKRRLRAKRRRTMRRSVAWTIAILVILVLGGGALGLYYWLNRPTGLASLPNPAVVAPGGFRASIGDNSTITVGLEVRSVADDPLTLVEARVVPPSGLTLVGLAIVPPGEDNEGFLLEGDLPSTGPVTLGTTGADRNAVVVARFTVTCAALPPADAPTGEQIFVTIRLGPEQRVEELTPPVVDDLPWLTATAQRVCRDPLPTTTPEPPLPPLPDAGATTPPA
jgi:hypothetical protein